MLIYGHGRLGDIESLALGKLLTFTAMRIFVRIFFRTLRILLTPFVLLWERLTTPAGIVRSPEEQARIDAETRGLALYQFKTCPFCIRVRRHLRRLSLNIPLRDAQHDPVSRDELLQGGGRSMVPCLKIAKEDGEVTWLYESAEIIAYLEERFGTPSAS